MSLVDEFQKASVDVQSLTERPDNMTMLKLYALYKQGTTGDVQGSRPGMMNMVARAKFDAWQNLAGTSKDEAMKQYVALVNGLLKA